MRRRLDGGMLDAEGEWPSLSSLVSSVRSSDAMEERGEPGESAIVLMRKLMNESEMMAVQANEKVRVRR